MSYIGEVRRSAFASFGTAAASVLVGAVMGSFKFLTALARRRHLMQLGAFDDRMLKDIGLTRADLRDAASGPLWQDPTSVLVVRSVERRASRRAAARDNLSIGAAKRERDDLISCG